MSENPRHSVQQVETTAALEQAIAQWQSAAWVCLDTEFHREKTYYPELCLVQLSAMDGDQLHVWLIDPLAEGLEMAPFWEWLRTSQQIKILHAVRQDLEIFFNHIDTVPSNLFDTQIAAMFCGYGDQISYAQLVRDITGETIEKAHQFSDWKRRPLSDRQTAYAAADVIHLPPIYHTLCQKLDESGRRSWVEEEHQGFYDTTLYVNEPDDAWKRIKLKTRSPRAIAMAQRLAKWREEEAKQLNKPRGWVLKDDAISEISGVLPHDMQRLRQCRSIGGHIPNARLEMIQSIIDTVHTLPDDQLPKPERHRKPPNIDNATVDLLKNLLKLCAEQEGIVPRMIASAEELRSLAQHETNDLRCMQGWRGEMFGQHAEALLNGDIGLGIANGQARVIPLSG